MESHGGHFLLPACTRQLYTFKAMQSNARGALALHKAEQVANIKVFIKMCIKGTHWFLDTLIHEN